MREAPAIAIIQTLQDAGAQVRAYDPVGVEQARLVLENVDYAESAYAAMTDADAVVIVTEWDAFRALDLNRVKSLLKSPVFVDLSNIYSAHEGDRKSTRLKSRYSCLIRMPPYYRKYKTNTVLS